MQEDAEMMDGWGFGYSRDEEGKLVRKENHKGKKLMSDVEIGAGTVIDDGSYRDTIIGEGTKIDNLCHIGHNALIGKHCLIVAHTVIGGSVEIGDFSYVGMGALVSDHIKVGKNVIIGAGAVVIRDVPDNDIVAGNPAISIKNRCTLSPKERFNMAGY